MMGKEGLLARFMGQVEGSVGETYGLINEIEGEEKRGNREARKDI